MEYDPVAGRSIQAPERRGVRGRDPAKRRNAVLTKDVLFGMNILSLVGFATMGISLTLRRMANVGAGLCFGLMSLGTVLVFAGFYAGANPQ